MVPASDRKPPFNQDRYLLVPHGCKIAVVARLPRARFVLSLTPTDTLVALPFSGRIVLVRETAPGQTQMFNFLKHLRKPQGMALWRGPRQTFLYVAESNQVVRMPLKPGDDAPGSLEAVVPGLPDGSSPELHGAYGHDLKDIVIGPDNKLYVDVASATNANPADSTQEEWGRPVDVRPAADSQSLLISDDSGTLYRLSVQGNPSR